MANRSFRIYSQARNLAHRPDLPSAQERQAPAARMRDVHTLIRAPRASQATRTIPHKREAL